jgi:hypothetical protein
MSVEVEQDVFRFKITIYDVERVQVVQSQCHLSSVEFRYRFRESLGLNEH